MTIDEMLTYAQEARERAKARAEVIDPAHDYVIDLVGRIRALQLANAELSRVAWNGSVDVGKALGVEIDAAQCCDLELVFTMLVGAAERLSKEEDAK